MSTDPQDTPRLLGEIAHGPSPFEQFLDRNQKNLIILSIAIALAVAAFLVYQGIANSHAKSAGADLCKADDLASLQSLIKEYPGTAAAGTAEIALAERQWGDGQQGTAIETLKAFVAANPKHPAIPTAKTSLAAKLKNQGKPAEATALFQELADDPDARFLAPYALLSLGDLAKAAGDLDQAEKSYQKAKTVLPGNSFSSMIDQRLANFKTKPPVEIDPPPTPPPAATTPETPAIPGSPVMPGSTAIPGSPLTPGKPAIPGLPPASEDTSDSDVPAVGNPFITKPDGTPKPPPAEAPGENPTDPVQEPAPATRSDNPAPPATPPATPPVTPPAGAPGTP